MKIQQIRLPQLLEVHDAAYEPFGPSVACTLEAQYTSPTTYMIAEETKGDPDYEPGPELKKAHSKGIATIMERHNKRFGAGSSRAMEYQRGGLLVAREKEGGLPLKHAIPPPELETRRHTLENFWNVLVEALFQLANNGDYTRPTGRVNVLVMGCGVCFEGLALQAFFGGNFLPEVGPQVFVQGIDLDKEKIQLARKLHQDGQGRPLPNFEFIHGRANSQTPGILQKADVVLIRHANASEPMFLQGYYEMFRHGISALTPGGILIVTSYNMMEHDVMLGFARATCNPVINEIKDRTNVFAEKHPYEDWYEDKHVLVVGRG